MFPILSVNTAVFDGYSFPEAFAEIAALGARYVEPAFTVGYTGFTEETYTEDNARSWRRAIADAGLACHSVSLHMDLASEGAVSAFDRRMAFAAGLGARIVISNTTSQDRADAFFRNMEPIARRAEELDLLVGLENPGNGSGNLLTTGAQALAVCRRIGSERVGLNFDIGNVLSYHRGARTPQAELEVCLPAVLHLHAKDVKDTGRGYDFVAIGQGDVDWSEVIEVAGRAPRPLGLAIEVPLRLRRDDYADPTRAAEREPMERIRRTLSDSLAFLERRSRQ